jgi:HSP20 family protein
MSICMIRKGTPMSQLTRHDPVFGPMDRLFQQFLTRDPFLANGVNDEEGTLALDVSDDGGAIVVEASLPGFKREDIAIEVDEGVLTINARHQETRDDEGEEDGVRFYRRERRFGSLSRRVALPSTVDQDKAQAMLVDGVLTLRLPKSERDLPRRIEIN